MGLVYLAQDPLLNRQVALKMVDLSIEDAGEREFLRERLLRDARAAAILSHPNIVGVYDIVEEGERAYIVMEYLEGVSLAAYLQNTPTPAPAFIVHVLRQMAAGLDYTHGKGVIHRDIKPGNVMLLPGGGVKILDFGIARINNSRTTTPAGMVMGTVEYMAPEQIKGEPLDGRADQFSLAALAYRMMTGSTLFGQHTLATLAYKMVNEVPLPARSRNATLPNGVDAILNRALAKPAEQRYATCQEFVTALEAAFSGGSAPGAAPARNAGTPHGKRAAYAGLAAGLVVVLAGGALTIWKPWAKASVAPRPAAPAAPAKPSAVRTPRPEARLPSHQLEPAATRPAGPAPAHREAAKAQASVRTRPEQLPARQPSSAFSGQTAAELYRRGQDQMKAHDFDAAVQSFTTVILRRPEDVAAWYSRAEARQLLEQNEAAIRDYSEAIRLAPSAALAYTGRGVCLVRTRQDDAAFSDFSRALALRPDLARALNGRGGVLLRRRQYGQAVRDFSQALRINPQFAQAYENRSRARRAMGDVAGAEADLRAEAELKSRANGHFPVTP